MDNRTMIGALALVAALTGTAQAETWYFTGNESSTDTGAFTDPTKWKDANGTPATAFSATDTYVLTNFGPGEASATEHWLRAHGGTFAGGARLELNGYGSPQSDRKKQHMYIESDCTPANPLVFPRGLLFGYNAEINPMAAGATNVIDGDVELIASDGGQNPIIRALEKDTTLVFNGKLTGPTKRGMGLYTADGATKRNFTIRFLGDVSWGGQGGQLYLYDSYTQIDQDCDYNIRLKFGNITFTPYIRVAGRPNNTFNARTRERLAVDSVNDTVTFLSGIDQKDRPLRYDTYLEFPVDVATGKAGKMVLNTQLYGRTNEWIGIVLTGNVFGGTETNVFELMSVPVAYPLNAAAFHVAKAGDINGSVMDEHVEFKVVNGATHSTLYAAVPPLPGWVRYVKSDDSGQNPGAGSRIESAEGWSDGSVPQPGRDYIVQPTNTAEMTLRTPDSDVSASYTFPGRSLTIASNACMRCYLHTLNVADLRMLNGSALYCSKCGSNAIDFNGNIDISGTVRIGTYNNFYMNFTNSTFTGSGTIDFGGLWIADNARANYKVWGNNSGFTGKMIVRTAYRDPKSIPTYGTDYGMLYVRDMRALGADLSTPTPDALTLTDYAYLWIDNGINTLARSSNRGITVRGCARIWQSSNVDFRMETTLTVEGECYKDGSGIMTLAGEAVAVNGGGADKFIVTNGTLCVASATALKGLALHFHRSTALMVKPNLDDDEFTEKGLDLSDLDTPLTLAPALNGKIPFRAFAAAAMPEAPFGTTEYGLFTVKTTFADTLRSMLPATPPRYFAQGRLSWTEKTVGDLTTFGVRCRRPAFGLIIR